MARYTRYRQTDLGREARCSKCREWWPADAEFFFMLRGDPHSWCKACFIAERVARGDRRNYGTMHCHNDHVRGGA